MSGPGALRSLAKGGDLKASQRAPSIHILAWGVHAKRSKQYLSWVTWGQEES